MKSRILILLLIFFQTSFAQKISLENALQKAQLYFELPQDSLVFYANYVIKNTKNQSEKGLAYHYLGNTHKINGNLDLALKNYQQEYVIFKKLLHSDENNILFKENFANSIGAMAIVYSNQSNYTKALNYHFRAKELFTQTDNYDKIAIISNNIAVEYQSLNKFDSANNYFLEAQKYNTNGVISNVQLYTNIARNYLKSNALDKAYTYLNKALLFDNKNENSDIKAELYNNLAFYYYKKNDFQNQKKYIDLAITFFQNNEFGLSDSYYYLGLYHWAKKENNQAKAYFKKSIQLSKKNNIIEIQSHAEEKLAQMYHANDDYKNALYHQQQFSKLNEILVANNNEKALAYEEQKSTFEEQKLQIKLLEQKNKEQFYTYSFALIALIALIAFLWYQNRQKLIKKNLILEKNISEFHQKSLHLQMNPHFVFNCLGSISGFILQNKNDEALDYLNHFAKLMRLTLENSKEKFISIEKEIESITQYFELEKLRHDAIFSYSILKTAAVDEVIKMPPMLLQPLIENAIIHGIIPKQDGTIEVKFDIEKQFLCITILDDGVGYYVSKNKKAGSVLAHKSMALDIVKNRIAALNGSFNIEQIEKENLICGTRIVLKLPL